MLVSEMNAEQKIAFMRWMKRGYLFAVLTEWIEGKKDNMPWRAVADYALEYNAYDNVEDEIREWCAAHALEYEEPKSIRYWIQNT